MKRQSCLKFILPILTFSICPSIFAGDSGWALVGKVGTEGIGAEVHCSLIPKVLNLRAGASFFQYSTDFSNKGIDYTAKLKLGAVPIGLDVYPFKNWFRIGGGLMVNLNKAEGAAKPSQGQITINGRAYPAEQLGELDANVKFNRVAPYFALGFGNPVKKAKRWGVYLDLGGMYHGTPNILLTATRTLPSQLQSDLAAQQQTSQNDIKKYSFFPIIQLGVGYHF